ncbi:MAG: pyridoxamine 5'-phosphate oxidase [Nitrincola lacisaponensis]|uniref:Pyridoxine/pyridoxamine 5'-phosphate oxidase n=1 Tax=Nitrincola lacisaponensis TaxID=267850 RepID=A0A063Y716_9GAMM|nr:pyridoxamine 5'-phosphate oxidase [Nitrincola lacisaponensis]KDE40541.1 Pyridoxamine 5'-phosphate oxidase [Nitrincola lacisaponensis]
MSQDKVDLSSLRREYVVGDLNREDLQDNPVDQFGIWFEQALHAYADEATAMTLATADTEGMPSARIVLLKQYDAQGFSWFTDYRSEKGAHLAQNPQAELLFYWSGQSRQVRIRGQVEKLPAEAGQAYFQQRPAGSRLSAAVSCQSHPVESRAVLEAAIEALRAQFPEGDVACPPQWGGYRLRPQRFEFWQGRPSRLHDRFIYQLNDSGQWTIQRLQP